MKVMYDHDNSGGSRDYDLHFNNGSSNGDKKRKSCRISSKKPA
jgi:hypothetical protein